MVAFCVLNDIHLSIKHTCFHHGLARMVCFGQVQFCISDSQIIEIGPT